jgi:hypothetical protein
MYLVVKNPKAAPFEQDNVSLFYIKRHLSDLKLLISHKIVDHLTIL